MIIHIVRFRSSLSDERIADLFQVRASEYLAVPGLLQKFYRVDESVRDVADVVLALYTQPVSA